MTIVSLNLDRELLESFYEKLSKLPPNLTPESISAGENDKQFVTSLDDLKQGEELPIDATGGYFLHAPDAKYGVSLSENEAKLFIECTFDENAEAILKQVAAVPVSYAYACQFEEREHQNRITAKKSYGTEEMWVGRDYRRYLPGIYWLNLIPKSLLEKHNIPEATISSLAVSCELIEDRTYLVQLYPSSENWKQRTDELDVWREVTPGVFNKAAAQQALNDAKTFMESSDISSEWK